MSADRFPENRLITGMPRSSTTWRPGCASPNPGGRPKALHSVQELAQQYTEQAIETLAEIMNNEDAPASARLSAAEALLNRGWGRPVQPTAQAETGTFEDWLDSLDDHAKELIDRELNAGAAGPDIDDDPAGSA